jgi:hypothetical protein
MKEITKRQVLAANLEAKGIKAVDIAKVCKVTPQTISAYRRMDEYQILVSKFSDEIASSSLNRLIYAFPKAVDVYIENLDNENELLRFRAAEGLMKLLGVERLLESIGATSYAELVGDKSLLDFEEMKAIYRATDEYLDECTASLESL